MRDEMIRLNKQEQRFVKVKREFFPVKKLSGTSSAFVNISLAQNKKHSEVILCFSKPVLLIPIPSS